MRRRLRKKMHRRHLTTVCAWVVTFDDGLRQRLLDSRPGSAFPISVDSGSGIGRLMAGRALRYSVAIARRVAAETAVVVYWADEFPMVRDEAVIFSARDLRPA